MRIWDLPVKNLCNRHLLGEHRELHAIWSILTNNKKGYSNHPETKRWVGKLAALYIRHSSLVKEISSRGYAHNSPLPEELADGIKTQNHLLQSLNEQIIILKNKKCGCFK